MLGPDYVCYSSLELHSISLRIKGNSSIAGAVRKHCEREKWAKMGVWDNMLGYLSLSNETTTLQVVEY